MAKTNPPLEGEKKSLFRHTDILFTFGLFGIISLLVLPVPAGLMDLLLTMSIGMALLIMMIVVYVKNPPEFSVFPTILLAITLFRLGLNIASTRLILLDGYAGAVIASFGNFVVQGNYVVGLVIFLILVIINFVVITKGAGRIAEVTARFTLDAMPGKQMAIDAELNAGAIDEPTARRRREAVTREADFYGAMDGASKFVRGDAIAGIMITLVNIVGGISIGVFQKDLGLMESLEKFTLLSIGDGLVSQIPSLLISVAAAILITRSSEKSNLGTHLTKQLTLYPRAIGAAGVMLLVFAIIPGLPFLPFAVLGGGSVFIAYMLKKNGIGLDALEELPDDDAPKQITGQVEGEAGAAAGAAGAPPTSEDSMRQALEVDIFTIELGYGLLGFADPEKGGDLIDRITGIRRNLAQDVGIIVPSVAVRDNLELESNQYRILVRGRPVGSSVLMPNRWMAMNIGESDNKLKGVPCTEPAFGLNAMWVTDAERRNAEVNGYTVVDPVSVLVTHTAELLKEHAHRMLEREDVQRLVDLVREKNSTLVNELLPDLVSIGLIQRVLQNLLQERIPIKNITVILETIADFAAITKNPDDLSEQVRKRLGVYFVEMFEAEPDRIIALTLDPSLEQLLIPNVKRTQFSIGLMMDPKMTEHIISELSPRVIEMVNAGQLPVLMTTAELRLAFKRFFEPTFPRLNVLAYQELPSSARVENFAVIPGINLMGNAEFEPTLNTNPELAQV